MEESNQDSSGVNKEDDDVVYQKGAIDRNSWKPADPLATYRKPFLAFWKQHFQQLNLRLVQPNDTEPVPDNAVNGHFCNYKREYKGPHVVLEGDYGKKLGDKNLYYTAVIDCKDPKRAFVGQYIEREHLVGGICYFDENGNQDGEPTPFDEPLYHFDFRDKRPAWDTLFLCGNTLCFLWSYRVSGFTRLYVWHLREDRLHGFSTHEMTQREEDVEGAPTNTQILDGRWLCSLYGKDVWRKDSPPARYLCIDLLSIREGDKSLYNYKEALYDRVLLPATMDPQTAIASLQEVPFYDFSTRDGYPVHCIKCGGDTVEGKIMPQDWGLGRGVCPKCRIRYSNSRKVWLCWNMVVNSITMKPRECNCVINDASGYLCPKATTHVDGGWLQDEECRERKPHRGKERGKAQAYMEFTAKPELEDSDKKKAKQETGNVSAGP